jgi:hypothetical protein
MIHRRTRDFASVSSALSWVALPPALDRIWRVHNGTKEAEMSEWVWSLVSRYHAVDNLHLPLLSSAAGRTLPFLLLEFANFHDVPCTRKQAALWAACIRFFTE